MKLHQRELDISCDLSQVLSSLQEYLSRHLEDDQIAVRFAVTEMKDDVLHCELGVLEDPDHTFGAIPRDAIFQFEKRTVENTEDFNAVLLVPTGIGSEIGGHAGDATPVLRAMGAFCDRVITHPNVVNASDINEMPENSLFVEGSVISRLLMGTVGLQPVRSNRLLLVADEPENENFVNNIVNSVSAARATLGLDVSQVVRLDPSIVMKAEYSRSGSAVGYIEGLERLWSALDEFRGEYDAIALSTVIGVPIDFHMAYFQSEGDIVNPWGGVEALLTHAVSLLYNLPSSHAPMVETMEVANLETGIVDPRMAAEAVSVSYTHCVLKGLHRSPKIIKDIAGMQHHSVLTAEDISCLVIPDGCVGLPTLAALEQGIPVIAVQENKNIMRNDLTSLPWKPGQLQRVDNYWEALGVLSAIKAGVSPDSLRRPLERTRVVSHRSSRPSSNEEQAGAQATEEPDQTLAGE